MSIPLSNIINITTNVLPPGNSGNNLYGLMLSKKGILPSNVLSAVSTAEHVGQLYGFDSLEYEMANAYFDGFVGSPKTPTLLYLAAWYTQSAPASLIGGSVAYLTLGDLQGFTGSISINVDGEVKTTDQIDLSKANSFSDAAFILSQGLGVTVTYSVSIASFVVTSGKTDSSSAVDFATGDLATLLRLTKDENAVKSTVVLNPTVKSFLDAMRRQNQQFCTVIPTWTPDQDEALAFAQWADQSKPKNQVAVILNNADEAASTTQTGASLGEKIAVKGFNNTVLVYDNFLLAAMIAGYAASLDINQQNGRYTATFRRNSNITPNVTDETQANALEANGYNFCGYYAAAFQDEALRFNYPGIISGDFANYDSWICQVILYRRFQRAYAELLLNKPQIPYNADGKGLISAAMVPAINDLVNFGVIRSGITLTDAQINTLKSIGLSQNNINSILTKGYFYAIGMNAVSGKDRLKGKSPPIILFYTDGSSVRRIDMTATEIQ